MHSLASNIPKHKHYQPLAGLLIDSIDVFDFAPGGHTFTITVTDTLGSSASDSFTFTTPEAVGRHSVTIVLWYEYHCIILCGSITYNPLFAE